MKTKLILAILFLTGVNAAYGQTEEASDSTQEISLQDILSEDNAENKKISKALKDNPRLKQYIANKEHSDSVNCNKIQQQDTTIQMLRDSIDLLMPIRILSDESVDIFSVELPAQEKVPASLKAHYNAVVAAKQLIDEIVFINEKANTLENTLSMTDKHKIIAEELTKRIEPFADKWIIFKLDGMTTFSDDQKNFIMEKIETPYNLIIKTYFANDNE